MGAGPYRYSQQRQPPHPPSAFFDGTRLGLEGTMLATLLFAIPGGLHIALSVTLGYAIRYAEGLPPEARAFSFGAFIFASIAGIISLSMLMFFGGAIPTMAYSMGLVSFMLRWVGKRRGRDRLVSTIIGSVSGAVVGVLLSSLLLLLMDMNVSGSLYATLFSWPEILTIDGIALLWLTLLPVMHAASGAQIGWRLGKMTEELSMYYFW